MMNKKFLMIIALVYKPRGREEREREREAEQIFLKLIHQASATTLKM